MRRRTVRAIFAAPLLLAIGTLAGLAAGLLGDGWWDAASWIGLGVPLVVVAVRYGGSSERRR